MTDRKDSFIAAYDPDHRMNKPLMMSQRQTDSGSVTFEAVRVEGHELFVTTHIPQAEQTLRVAESALTGVKVTHVLRGGAAEL